eukprot:jgi/Botrbrau1/22894/Bobra.0065s0047.1
MMRREFFLAEEINAHLPREVRVLSVQRANRSWNARTMCDGRTYHYYLPAMALGLRLDGGEEDKERLSRFRECLRLYEGSHAFHNFTQRRRYRPGASRQPTFRKKQEAGENGAPPARLSGNMPRLEEPAGPRGCLCFSNRRCRLRSPMPPPPILRPRPLPADPARSFSPKPLRLQVGGGVRSGRPDREGALPHHQESHCRSSRSFQRPGPRFCAGPLILLLILDSAAVSCAVKQRAFVESHRSLCHGWSTGQAERSRGRFFLVTIEGQSFMIHQIRHMVGAAVSVALGAVPLQYIEASLCRPSRTYHPLAPAAVLVLADSHFLRFPSDLGNPETNVRRWSGERLNLRSRGSAAREAFCAQVLFPSLERLMTGGEWAAWIAETSGADVRRGADGRISGGTFGGGGHARRLGVPRRKLQLQLLRQRAAGTTGRCGTAGPRGPQESTARMAGTGLKTPRRARGPLPAPRWYPATALVVKQPSLWR